MSGRSLKQKGKKTSSSTFLTKYQSRCVSASSSGYRLIFKFKLIALALHSVPPPPTAPPSSNRRPSFSSYHMDLWLSFEAAASAASPL